MIVRLSADARSAIRRHLAALDAEDRYLRFGHHPGESALDDYVSDLDFGSSDLFGAIDEAGDLIGVVHVGRRGSSRELGMSVLQAARHQGLGAELLRRAIQHAAEEGADRVVLQCVAENHAIIELAQRHGAHIEHDAGTVTAIIEPIAVAA